MYWISIITWSRSFNKNHTKEDKVLSSARIDQGNKPSNRAGDRKKTPNKIWRICCPKIKWVFFRAWKEMNHQTEQLIDTKHGHSGFDESAGSDSAFLEKHKQLEPAPLAGFRSLSRSAKHFW